MITVISLRKPSSKKTDEACTGLEAKATARKQTGARQILDLRLVREIDRVTGVELARLIRPMVLDAPLLQLPGATRTMVAALKMLLEQVVGIVTRADLLVGPHRQVSLITVLIGAARISLLSGCRDQMNPMEGALDRCWVNHQQVSRKSGGGQVNCWGEVLPLILLVAGAEVLNKGLHLLVLGRPEVGGQVGQKGALTLGVNRFFDLDWVE